MDSDKKSTNASLLRPMVLIPAVVALMAAGAAGWAAMAWQADIETTEQLKAEQVELVEAIADRERRAKELELMEQEAAERQALLALVDRATEECESVSFDRRATLQKDILALPLDVQEMMELVECPEVFEWMIEGDDLTVEVFTSFSNTCEWESSTRVRYEGTFTNTSRTWTLNVMFEASIENANGVVVDREQFEFVNVAPREVVEWSATLDTVNHEKSTCVMDGAVFFIWPSAF